MREISYTSVKLGGYGPIKTALGADQEDSGFAIKFLAGSVAGGAGSLCGNPFDVMKTMMMADAKNKTPLPELMGRMYREQVCACIHAFIHSCIHAFMHPCGSVCV